MKNVEDVYLLTPMQESMLLHTLATRSGGVLFNQFAYGLNVYAEHDPISGYEIEGNVAFNNGAAQGYTYTSRPYLFVGSPTIAADNITLTDNNTYQTHDAGDDRFHQSWIPEKAMKPTDIRPTRMKVTPRPRRGAGTSLYLSFSRIAASATMASAQPTPEPRPKTVASASV